MFHVKQNGTKMSKKEGITIDKKGEKRCTNRVNNGEEKSKFR